MHIPKRRIEALESAPSIIPSMIERALEAGVSATYVLNGHVVYATASDPK